MTNQRPGEEPISDERLLAEFIAGQDTAFEALVGRYSRDLHQFVTRFVRSSAAADDVVQETFVQVYHSAEGFDTERRFRPWLFTIAANKARDFLRARARKREVSLSVHTGNEHDGDAVSYLDFMADTSELPGEAVEAEEQRRIVQGIVSELPDPLREILVLGYYQRFPYKEIAEILAIPLGTVKSRLHAAVTHFGVAYRRELDRQSRKIG